MRSMVNAHKSGVRRNVSMYYDTVKQNDPAALNLLIDLVHRSSHRRDSWATDAIVQLPVFSELGRQDGGDPHNLIF